MASAYTSYNLTSAWTAIIAANGGAAKIQVQTPNGIKVRLSAAAPASANLPGINYKQSDDLVTLTATTGEAVYARSVTDFPTTIVKWTE
jgi:phage tail protein X